MRRLRRRCILISLLWAFGGMLSLSVSCQAAEPRVKKVLFIGIDGVRPDTLQVADTPYLNALKKDGAFANDTQILGERYRRSDTVSAAGWSSILTGVWADKHGVHDSRFEGKNFEQYPDFLHRLKRARPEAKTAVFASWEAIAQHIVKSPDVLEISRHMEYSLDAYLEADRQVAARARRHLAEENPDAIFVSFILPDVTGHQRGFDPRGWRYRRAIEIVDGLVGIVLRAMWARRSLRNEDWLVLVTSDHGGRGMHHRQGHQDREVLTVFIIVSGDAAQRGKITSPTYIVDPAATALRHLGVMIDEAWGLDGRVVGLQANPP